MHKLCAAVLLLLAPGLATAQVYKCTGKDGRATYSQTRPRDGDCQESRISAPPPMGADLDSLKAFGEQVDKSREAEAGVRARAEQQQAQKDARCSQWRRRLAALEQASRVFTVDEKGERHYRTDEQNDAMRDEARQGVAAECG
jgi:Domain of unknown function (DUF4124)